MALDAPREVGIGDSVAQVYDYGAHVWSWSLDGHPVLWASAKSAFEPDKALRGGVPICWPWFGPGRTGDLTPAHGFARISEWELAGRVDRANAEVVTYVLSPEAAPDALPGEDWRVTYEVSVGKRLTLELTVDNLGVTSFSYELALHTYLSVGDVRQVTIAGLDGASYLDKVTGHAELQVGDVTIGAETDRVYDRSGDIIVTDPVLRRRLRIATQGAANTVVWNPWVAKAAAMPDFGDDEWPQMLCIEGGNVLDHAVTLEPGASATLQYKVSVEAT